jgi:hypothetical protein
LEQGVVTWSFAQMQDIQGSLFELAAEIGHDGWRLAGLGSGF